MTELAAEFNLLPSDYQEVLHHAQETHRIAIAPLQELKGGRTGAFLYLVSINSSDTEQVRHLVLKLDHKNKKTDLDELKRHRTALSKAPPEFARRHIADLAFERIEHKEMVAIFYTIAGQSLHHYRSLASCQQQNKLERLFAMAHELLISGWNKKAVFRQAVHPQKLLADWLGYRLKPGGNIDHFLEEVCQIHPGTPGLLIGGNAFPNPLFYARESAPWEGVRPIDALTGFQHGDLNIGNILARFSENEDQPDGFYLIDFALFKEEMPLFYDQHYLEMSYLIREVSRLLLPKWVDLVTRFAEGDIIDAQQIPVELAGACAVICAGRRAFANLVEASFPSLSDDLWGQYWLAAVAAGLNYCNKTMISEKERLGALVFAAAHLKRFHTIFGIALPAEVKHLDIAAHSSDSPGSETPAPPRLTSPAQSLPSLPTSFIGREQELAAIGELLLHDEVRLLTLTGPGGTGKTRLALQTAASLTGQYEDGVYFIDLAPVHESDTALSVIARTIGLRETGDRPLVEALKNAMVHLHLLLLLDNVEQVTAVAPSLSELLRGCAQLQLLVTSREALHISGEQVFPVPPLALPGGESGQISVQQLTGFESIRLFVDRARTVKPDFELTDENAQAVIGICEHLDGLPLAIELAAARLTLFSAQALLERIGSRLKLLRGGARDLPARQQTLRDTIHWSYQLLNDGEQRLFALLSVFSGCTLEAIETVAGDIPDLDKILPDILDGVTSLVNKSLIRRVDHDTSEIRLQMLETIREYAAEQLAADSEFSASASRAHARFYADFTQRLWDNLTGAGREQALNEMAADLANIQSTWRYWVKEKDAGQLRKLIDCLWLLYDARGWHYAMIDLTTDLLNVFAAAPSSPEHAQQEIMLQTSLARVLMASKGYSPEVEQAYTRALKLCEAHGEIPQMLAVLRGLASYYVYIADFENGVKIGEQILRLAEQHDDLNMHVEGSLILGYCLAFLGNLKLGMEHLEKAMRIFNPEQSRSHSLRFGNNPGVACLTTSALFLWMLGFPDRAIRQADDAVALARRLTHPFSMAYALFHNGLLHLWRGEAEPAGEQAKAVLDIAGKYEFQIWRAVASCLQGASLAGLNRGEEGLNLIRQGMDLYNELKTPPVFWPLLLIMQAAACSQAGRPGEGLNMIDTALSIIGKGTGNPIFSEICRLKGDLILADNLHKQAEAETWYRQALENARARQTSMMALRAAVSLSRLWQTQGKKEEGWQLLSDIYETFTEGFSTTDLTEAKILMTDLS